MGCCSSVNKGDNKKLEQKDLVLKANVILKLDNPEMLKSRYQIFQELGQGAYGQVKLCIHKGT